MGNAALKMDTGVRRLRPADLEQVIAIDSHHFGEPRRAFFEKRLAQARKHPEDYAQVGVDRNGVTDSRGGADDEEAQAGGVGDRIVHEPPSPLPC